MKKTLIITVLLAGAFTACTKDSSLEDGMVHLRINPTVTAVSEQQPGTRAGHWEGFKQYDVVGLSIVKKNTLNPYYTGYENVRAAMGTATWAFRPAGIASNTTPSIGIFRTKGEVDIYGYYPYDASVNAGNIKGFPFTLGTTDETNLDYMVSVPMSYDPAIDEEELSPQFHHVMTVLEFRVQTSYVGPMQLNFIKLHASEPIFGMSGTIDATVQNPANAVTLSPSSLTDELTINYDVAVPYCLASGNNPKYYSAAMIFPGVEVDASSDVTVTVTFDFDTDMALFEKDGSYTINLKDLVVSDNDVNRYGFLPGYRYILPVKVDNFIKYAGYPTVVYWSDGETFEIEI